MVESPHLPAARPDATATPAIVEQVVVAGDLAKLTPAQRGEYYGRVCASLGLNPFTRPFEYLLLNGKLTLYARKDATDQLRAIRRVSLEIVSRETVGGIHVVTARATLPDGRTDEEIGAVGVTGLTGEALANALMKASTKAKRRVTLSVCGLGWLDESEADAVADARAVRVDVATGEILDRVEPTPALGAPAADDRARTEAYRAAATLHDEATRIGLAPTMPPATATDAQLARWSAHWRASIARSQAGDPDEVAVPNVPAAPDGSDELDELDAALGRAPVRAPTGRPAWAATALGREVSELVDRLNAVGARFRLPADDAADAELEGWIASKRGVLKGRGGPAAPRA